MAVEIGQVYRDKDKRKNRCVRVLQRDIKWGKIAFWCQPCDENGKFLSNIGLGKNNHRTTCIPETSLEKRFALVATQTLK